MIANQRTTICFKRSPPTAAPWEAGAIQDLKLKIAPKANIAASCNYDNHPVLVFEMGPSSGPMHLSAAVWNGKNWNILPRPHYQLQASPGGPLSIYHPGSYSGEFSILYQAATTGSVCQSTNKPDLKEAYVTEEIIPKSALPVDSYGTDANIRGARIRCTTNAYPWIHNSVAAVRDNDNMISVSSWEKEAYMGRSLKTIHRVCRTKAGTDFGLAQVSRKRVLVFYLAEDGLMEMVVLDIDDVLKPPEKHPRWPVFHDSCFQFTSSMEDNDDSSS